MCFQLETWFFCLSLRQYIAGSEPASESPTGLTYAVTRLPTRGRLFRAAAPGSTTADGDVFSSVPVRQRRRKSHSTPGLV